MFLVIYVTNFYIQNCFNKTLNQSSIYNRTKYQYNIYKWNNFGFGKSLVKNNMLSLFCAFICALTTTNNQSWKKIIKAQTTKV